MLEDKSVILGGSAEINGTGPMLLGVSRERRYYLHGKLDEVLLYNRALGPTEIHHLYQIRESGPCRV